jgi:hypothetical protein
MKYIFTIILVILIYISLGSGPSEAQLPVYQDEFSIQAPDQNFNFENKPECDEPEPTYIYCESDEPCLGLFPACAGELNLNSPSEHAIYFYVWSKERHKIEADGSVDENAGKVKLKSIRWQWYDDGWTDISYNNSGDFNNFQKKLKSVGGGIYKLKFRVYAEKVKIECDASGEYYFTAKLEVIYPI